MATQYNELKKNRSLAPSGNFIKELDKMKPQIAAALPRHLNADRMSRIALTEFRKNPKLGECNVTSVLGSIVTLSQLGLEPGIMGQAFLVPYKGICQPIPGWQGIVDLVSRTGRATVWTGAVFDGDEFDYALGDRPFIVHRPGDNHGEEEDQITHFYSVGRVNGAEWPVIEVWTTRRVMRHRNKHNKVGDKHYSYGNWEMYGRKVPLLQVCKYMPKSVELQKALDMEGAANEGRPVPSILDGDFTDLTGQGAGNATGNATGEDNGNGKSASNAKLASETGNEKKPSETQAHDYGDGAGESGFEPMNFSEAFKAIIDAKTVDDLDVIRSRTNHLPEQKRKNISASIENKMNALEAGAGASME
jgi:recombination protein RecT